MSFRPAIRHVVCMGFALSLLGAEVELPKAVEPFLQTYCYDCHGAETAKADLNLETLTRTIDNPTDAQHWQDIVDQLNAGEMPPKKKKQPSKAELAAAIGEFTNTLFAAQELLQDSGGAIVVRRLNRREYAATIMDLMGIRLDAGGLPDDASGRFDTIGQNQSLNALQLQGYFSFNQEVAQMALHWACEARKASVVQRKAYANTEGRSKTIYEIMEKVKLVKEGGKTPAEAGLTEAEWPKYDPDGPNAQRGVWKGQQEYYDRNRHIHDKGRMLSHDLLVEHVSLFFPHDARGHYRIRFCGGVVDGVAIRRAVRLMKKNGKLSGKHGSAFGSFLISGTIDEPSVHETTYFPFFEPNFRPANKNASRNFVFVLEDKRGGPGFEQFYHHYKPIEPGVPKDTIFAKWMEVEGPFYRPKSPFERLVDKYEIASATDDALDSVTKDFLAAFAESAFRHRGIPDGLIEKLAAYYQAQRQAGLSFAEAIVDPLAMLLSSTRFLYLVEPEDTKAEGFDAITLAQRLAYFLWSRPADAELIALAQEGSLRRPEVLAQQVDRMLKSPKAEAFFEGFVSQWMHLER
ncbi:MAG: hypothetical protein ACI8W8_004426, partial [Rhodothermales bacterium]